MNVLKGNLFIISGPSGSGKNTLIDKVLQLDASLAHSISTTTREPRRAEVDGVNYNFITKKLFEKMIEKKSFLEYAKLLNNYYGTTWKEIHSIYQRGLIPILDLDVQGALQVKGKYPWVNIIFIRPPSLEILAKRLRKRQTENQQKVTQRLQLAEKELLMSDRYDHEIVNDELETSSLELLQYIQKNQ